MKQIAEDPQARNEIVKIDPHTIASRKPKAMLNVELKPFKDILLLYASIYRIESRRCLKYLLFINALAALGLALAGLTLSGSMTSDYAQIFLTPKM